MPEAYLHCQDSLDPWSLPDDWEAPKAVFTSPRYNKGMDYGATVSGGKIGDDDVDSDYLSHLSGAWSRCHRETDPKASLWINSKPDSVLDTLSVCVAESSGWVLQTVFAWVYHLAMPDGQSLGQFNSNPKAINPHSGFELVRLYHKAGEGPVRLRRDAPGVGVPYMDKSNLTRFTAATRGEIKPDLRCRGNVWVVPYETRVRRDHPCPFPTRLPELAFRLLDLPPRSVVADPFCGTGAAGVAAVRCGLKFVGLDLNPSYVDAARSRLSKERLFRALGVWRDQGGGEK